MKNTVHIQLDKTLDHDSLVLASLIVNDVNQLIRCVHAIVAVLVRYAAIAVSISNSLRRYIEPVAATQQRKHAQCMPVSLQGISTANLPLAG